MELQRQRCQWNRLVSAMAGGGVGDRTFPDEGARGGIEGLQHGGHAPARVMAKMPVALPVSKATSPSAQGAGKSKAARGQRL